MNHESLNEIKLLLAAEERPIVFLATVDPEGKPRVRPLNLMSTPRGFYIATSKKSRKIRELKGSDAVEMVTIFPTEKGTGYLRITGKAREVNGQEKRSTIEETHYPVEKYWNGVDDPDFMVFRIDPERVEYIRPGEDDPMDVTATFSRSTRK